MKITKLFAALFTIAIAATFASCSPAEKGDKKTADSVSENNSSIDYNGKIAYIRMDSLMRGYGMYIDLSDEFTKKGQKIEEELTQKGRSLEREITDYQTKAEKGLVTRFEGQTIEQGLQKKQQDVVQYRDKMMGEMQQEEAVISNKISTEVMNFLKEYNQTKGYSMIFQSTANTPVLLADPTLDITNDVLTELNKRYLDSKKTSEKK